LPVFRVSDTPIRINHDISCASLHDEIYAHLLDLLQLKIFWFTQDSHTARHNFWTNLPGPLYGRGEKEGEGGMMEAKGRGGWERGLEGGYKAKGKGGMGTSRRPCPYLTKS